MHTGMIMKLTPYPQVFAAMPNKRLNTISAMVAMLIMAPVPVAARRPG